MDLNVFTCTYEIRSLACSCPRNVAHSLRDSISISYGCMDRIYILHVDGDKQYPGRCFHTSCQTTFTFSTWILIPRSTTSSNACVHFFLPSFCMFHLPPLMEWEWCCCWSYYCWLISLTLVFAAYVFGMTWIITWANEQIRYCLNAIVLRFLFFLIQIFFLVWCASYAYKVDLHDFCLWQKRVWSVSSRKNLNWNNFTWIEHTPHSTSTTAHMKSNRRSCNRTTASTFEIEKQNEREREWRETEHQHQHRGNIAKVSHFHTSVS